MIGDGEVQSEQADDGADQPFGLPERQAEDGSQGQRRQDRQGREVGLPAPGRTWLGLPRLDGFIGEPDRQAPALAQAGVVLTPVRYLALLPGNMLATVLVQLDGHAGHPGAGERSYCYSGSTCSATGRIRATTPRTAQRITSAGKRKPRNARAVVMDGILGRVMAGVPLLPRHAAPLNATKPRTPVPALKSNFAGSSRSSVKARNGVPDPRSRGKFAGRIGGTAGTRVGGV